MRSASSPTADWISARVFRAGAVEQFVREVLDGQDLQRQHRGEFVGGLVLTLREKSLLPEIFVSGLRLAGLEHDLDRDDVDDDADHRGPAEHPQPGRQEVQDRVEESR